MLGDVSLSTVGFSASISIVTGYLGTLLNLGRLRNRDRRIYGLSLLAEVKSLQRVFRRYYNRFDEHAVSACVHDWPALHFSTAETSVFNTGAGNLGLFSTRTAVEVIEFYSMARALAAEAQRLAGVAQDAGADKANLHNDLARHLRAIRLARHHSRTLVSALRREIPSTASEIIRHTRRRAAIRLRRWRQRTRGGGIETRPVLSAGRAVLVAVLAVSPVGATRAQPTPSAPDTIDARLLACAACHGTQGQGTDNDYFPRLAGKPAGYLMNQLVAFRDGRRRYPPMNYLLEYIPDAYLQQMADHFAALRPPPVPQAVADASSAVMARGRSIVAEGDAAHGVPACSRCHGPALTGMEPAIPGLVGLHASYISAQLGAWRYGTRTAAAPDCMQIVAASLTESDVTAVAAWLSSVPIPADPSPAPHGTLPMPLACGSEPN